MSITTTDRWSGGDRGQLSQMLKRDLAVTQTIKSAIAVILPIPDLNIKLHAQDFSSQNQENS